MNHIQTITQKVEWEKSEPKSVPYIAGFLLGSGTMKVAYSHDISSLIIGGIKMSVGYIYGSRVFLNEQKQSN